MWSQKTKQMNKTNRSRLIDTEDKVMVARGEELGGRQKKGKGTERDNLSVVT